MRFAFAHGGFHAVCLGVEQLSIDQTARADHPRLGTETDVCEHLSMIMEG